MNKIIKTIVFAFLIASTFISCSSDDESTPTEPKLIFKFKFDSTQVRLDGFGNPAPSPVSLGHGAQSPVFNKMSAHYIELAQTATTLLGNGAVLYHATETTAGGSTAIQFNSSTRVGNGETFFSVPLKDVASGTYQYLRVSLAYQNYDIKLRASGFDLTGTVASFIGYNTYLTNYVIKDSTVNVNANRAQGYWAFEIHNPGFSIPQYVFSGQVPVGATTVPNPLSATSPIPAGSCVVTGPFSSALHITGNETSDIVVTVSLSTNKSFEWVEHSTVGYYEPAAGDTVVDMGIRGLIPIVN